MNTKIAVLLCLFGYVHAGNLYGGSAFESSALGHHGSAPGYRTNLGDLSGLGYGATLGHGSGLGYGSSFGHGASVGYGAGQGYNGWQGYGSGSYGNGDYGGYGASSAYSRSPVASVTQYSILHTPAPFSSYSAGYSGHGAYAPIGSYGNQGYGSYGYGGYGHGYGGYGNKW